MNPKISTVFDTYPKQVKIKLLALRTLIYDVAKQIPCDIDESIKWGEPTYSTKMGSPIRIDWKGGDTYALYFICTTSLVAQFKERYPELSYENNRAIIFNLNEKIPVKAICDCVQMALVYKKS